MGGRTLIPARRPTAMAQTDQFHALHVSHRMRSVFCALTEFRYDQIAIQELFFWHICDVVENSGDAVGLPR